MNPTVQVNPTKTTVTSQDNLVTVQPGITSPTVTVNEEEVSVTAPQAPVNTVTVTPSPVTVESTAQTVTVQETIGGDKNYVHSQSVPASTWTINHPLQKFPAVQVVDSAGSMVYGDVNFINLNTVQVTFQSSFSGQAYLN